MYVPVDNELNDRGVSKTDSHKIKDQNESGKENNEDEKLFDMDTNLQEDESKENISDKPKDPKKRESFLDKLTEKLKDFLENAE